MSLSLSLAALSLDSVSPRGETPMVLNRASASHLHSVSSRDWQELPLFLTYENKSLILSWGSVESVARSARGGRRHGPTNLHRFPRSKSHRRSHPNNGTCILTESFRGQSIHVNGQKTSHGQILIQLTVNFPAKVHVAHSPVCASPRWARTTSRSTERGRGEIVIRWFVTWLLGLDQACTIGAILFSGGIFYNFFCQHING